jgi:hypothetical protein
MLTGVKKASLRNNEAPDARGFPRLRPREGRGGSAGVRRDRGMALPAGVITSCIEQESDAERKDRRCARSCEMRKRYLAAAQGRHVKTGSVPASDTNDIKEG